VFTTVLRVFLIAVTVFLAAFYSVVCYFARRRIKARKYLACLKKVSVIVPAYNEEGVVDNLLKDLKNSSFQVDKTIVLDDNSTDSTYEAAKKMNAIVIRNETRLGKAATLNKGARIAQGDILVVFDADNRPEKDCIEQLTKHFDSKSVGIVTGVTKILSDGFVSRLAALEFALCFYLFQPFFTRFNFLPVLHGAYFGIRRELASFDENALTEDFDISVDAALRGYLIEFEPQAVSYVSPPPSLHLFTTQREKWIRGAVEVCFKRKGFWKKLFPHIGFLGLFLMALGYLLPLVWASSFTLLLLCYFLGEFFLMYVAFFSMVIYTFIVSLAIFRSKNSTRNIFALPLLGFFYLFFVVWFFVKAVVLEYFGFRPKFDRVPHKRNVTSAQGDGGP